MARDPATRVTDRQRRFCEEYLKDFNAAAAYRRAGYAATGESARRAASRLLTNVDIQYCLSSLRSRTSQQAEVTLERTLKEISRVAFANITDALSFNDHGVEFKDSGGLPADVVAAIESVTWSQTDGETTSTTRKSLKMHNKMSALGFLADYFGIRDDFNKARATLKRYGLALVEDAESSTGWRLEQYDPTGANSAD